MSKGRRNKQMTEMKRVEIVECKKCGHKWLPRTFKVRLCAKCKTTYWNETKGDPQ